MAGDSRRVDGLITGSGRVDIILRPEVADIVRKRVSSRCASVWNRRTEVISRPAQRSQCRKSAFELNKVQDAIALGFCKPIVADKAWMEKEVVVLIKGAETKSGWRSRQLEDGQDSFGLHCVGCVSVSVGALERCLTSRLSLIYI